jgi:hypothetical protein
MIMLAVVAVVAIAVTSQHMGSVQLMQTTELHSRGFSVADAILESAGVHDKKVSIPASIAALAAQAAEEKETGKLTATVELPQISKKMAAEAAEAKKEIMIEQVGFIDVSMHACDRYREKRDRTGIFVALAGIVGAGL